MTARRALSAFALAALASCTGGEVVLPDAGALDAPAACRLPSDCARGTHCGDDRVCTFDCREDRDCLGVGARCDTVEGRCLAPDAGSPDASAPPDVTSPPDATTSPDVASPPDVMTPEGDYHVAGSMEGETTGGGGDEVTLRAGLCVRLPVMPYQVTGYHHGDSVGAGRVHGGDDVHADVGTRVYAVWNGQVVTARRISTWGTLVELRHNAPDGTAFYSIYGHLRETGLAVRPGQTVQTGDLLGSIGARTENGGWAPHLHFGIFSGTYPTSGVLKGHVLPAELPSYPDPVPFLERHGMGAGCGVDPCAGETCSGHGACAAGRCACATGYTGTRCERCADGLGDCDGIASNGCETSTQSSDANCGACGRACGAGERCTAGACASTCLAPRRACGVECVDVTTSTAHCGACFNACGADARCNAGRCEVTCGDEGLPCCAGSVCRTGTCRGGTCARVPTETCNGVDDDGDGTVDNPLSCWRTLYRFVDRSTGARCVGPTTSAPSACAGYAYEREAFVVAVDAAAGAYPIVQCSRLTDHILVEQGSPDASALSGAGYACGAALGYVFRSNPGRTPFSATCPVWRYRYTAGGTGAHIFTTGSDSSTGLTCEAPSRGWAGSTVPCFGASAPGC